MQGEIVSACEADLERILQIYESAKKYMHENGNPNQWNGAYPDRATLENDIVCNRLYVYKIAGKIQGVFVLLLDKETTYEYIEGGQWLNEEPYGTIHRIAGSREITGFFGVCLEFCRKQIKNIRLDTHEDNHVMQHLAEKHGFVRCGRIYLKDGNPRIAYHLGE